MRAQEPGKPPSWLNATYSTCLQPSNKLRSALQPLAFDAELAEYNGRFVEGTRQWRRDNELDVPINTVPGGAGRCTRLRAAELSQLCVEGIVLLHQLQKLVKGARRVAVRLPDVGRFPSLHSGRRLSIAFLGFW